MQNLLCLSQTSCSLLLALLMAPGMDASQLLPKSRLGDTRHCSAGLVFLLSCTFAWRGFGGKPRCAMLNRTGTNPCSRGGGGRAVIQTAPSSALMTFTCTDSRVWGNRVTGCCSRGSPTIPGPSQVCSMAMDLSPWKQHLLGLGPPGGSRTPAAFASYHLFLIGLSSTGWLCLQEGPEQQQSSAPCSPWSGGDNPHIPAAPVSGTLS